MKKQNLKKLKRINNLFKKLKVYFFYLQRFPQVIIKAPIYLILYGPNKFIWKMKNIEKKVSPVAFSNISFFEKILIFFNPSFYIKGVKILLTKGPIELISKIKSKIGERQIILDINSQYQIWLKKNYPEKKELRRQKKEIKKFKYQPLISIITPVYNPAKSHLIECIESVISQSYDNWELCLVDDVSSKKYVRQILLGYQKKDSRIKVKFRDKNGHICRVSNDALSMAKGDYIALLDHDDFLWPNALYEVVKLLNKKPLAQFIYSDEDKLDYDGKKHIDPFFKPDWSPDYFRSINYITHFAVLKKSLVDKVSRFRIGTEGAQDWDLFLRASYWLEKNIGHCHPLDKKNPIQHISTVLYSWRKTFQSTSSEKNIKKVKSYSYKNQIKAVKYFYKKIFRINIELLFSQTNPGVVDTAINDKLTNFNRLKKNYIINQLTNRYNLKKIIPHLLNYENKIFVDYSSAKKFFIINRNLQNSLYFFYSKIVINNFYSLNQNLLDLIKKKKIPFLCSKATFNKLLKNKIKIDKLYFLSYENKI